MNRIVPHNKLVQDFLQDSAYRLPDKIALICENQRLTYHEINSMSNRLANALIDKGLQRSDRVAIFLPNSIATVISIFAILKAGGTFVVINHTTKGDKLNSILDNCTATAVISDDRNRSIIQEIMYRSHSINFCVISAKASSTPPVSSAPGKETIDKETIDFDTVLASYPDTTPPRRNIDLDLACLIYTSGSTGNPKGVMSDHSNISFASSSIIEYIENKENDIVINVLPLSFDYGLYQLLMVFKFGGTLVLERGFTFPAQILKRIEHEHVTGFPGVPTIFSIILQLNLDSFDLSSLRYITNTAAALPPSHIQGLKEKFPDITIFSMYGLTETKRTLYLHPDQLDMRPGSVGKAIPHTEVWLENEEGYKLGSGEIGELVIRGRHVMRGYWANPEATAKRYRSHNIPGERVCYSGDFFRMDEDGFFYFVSRKDDIIKSRGEKVAPKEVENVLYKLEGVREVAVIGIEDPILGEAIKAFIVTDNPDISETQALAHCRANLEDFMVPKFIELIDDLPKTTSGKIKKTGLA